MKRLLGYGVVVAIVLLAFNYYTTGELALLPKSASKDARQLRELETEYRTAARDFMRAGRGAAITGMDTTSEAGTSLVEVDRIETEIKRLAKSTTEDDVRTRASELLKEIQKFKRDVKSE